MPVCDLAGDTRSVRVRGVGLSSTDVVPDLCTVDPGDVYTPISEHLHDLEEDLDLGETFVAMMSCGFCSEDDRWNVYPWQCSNCGQSMPVCDLCRGHEECPCPGCGLVTLMDVLPDPSDAHTSISEHLNDLEEVLDLGETFCGFCSEYDRWNVDAWQCSNCGHSMPVCDLCRGHAECPCPVCGLVALTDMLPEQHLCRVEPSDPCTSTSAPSGDLEQDDLEKNDLESPRGRRAPSD